MHEERERESERERGERESEGGREGGREGDLPASSETYQLQAQAEGIASISEPCHSETHAEMKIKRQRRQFLSSSHFAKDQHTFSKK